MPSVPGRTPIVGLVLDQLAEREMRLLTLVVAIRKRLVPPQYIKGELPALVQSAIRGLVASHQVVETDGVYSLVKKSEKSPGR